MQFISQEKILKVLIGYNPWWTASIVPREFTKPVKRLAFYEANKLFNHPSIRREVILSGPRRVGKTTILYQTIEQVMKNISPKQILYVSFDHPMLKLCDIGTIIEVFINNIALNSEELYLFFDEIQYASDWDTWLKTLYDQNPYYKIMATGSASPILASKMSESGVGRWSQIKIPTLSFYEYIELLGIDMPNIKEGVKPTALAALKKEDLASLMVSLQPLQKHFHQYLLIGGFPEVALSNDVPFAQKIIREDVVDKVIKRDMVSLFGIRNVAELEKIFLFICMVSGNIIVQDTIAKEVGVSRPTIANYLELLEQANLIYISKPTEIKGKKVLKSRPKIYLADAAIRNAVLMLGEEVLTDPDEMGLIIETAVYKHILSFYYNQRPQVGYFRDSNSKKEIDVVVSFPMGRIIIEVKYRENSTISEKEAIVEWANHETTKGAILITKNSDDYGIAASHVTKTPIIRIPAFAFLYLLGYAEKEHYKQS
ncbi:ATP-binding protein [Ammoniphilus sp. CFH 90114]|uniref:ATP-binding protein n=1 Tax=Ammoniphilus sp. CFH 90114 TaxID=2493665 RepID=UPI00100F8C23|nr:ATP-binding protein [Ammoniphilus sp. CFH 90114]RXT03662.1 ATP-binding protein [Ammoniphilus sp. CFH 90114]